MAITVAENLFGLSVDDPECVKELDSYDDKNFFMSGTLPDGTEGSFTLKVHNGVESSNFDVLDCQNSILCHLRNKDFLVPHPTAAVNEESIAFEEFPTERTVHEGEEEEGDLQAPTRSHAVRLLHWVEGTPMSNLTPKPNSKLLFKAGRYLAEMTTALEDFDHPGAHRVHSWDLLQTPNIRSFIYTIQGERQQRLVESVIKAYEAMEGWETKVPWGVLQADFNDANIILDNGLGDLEEEQRARKKPRWKIGGVIDFGDVVYSCQVNDVAIAMAYHMLGQHHPVQAAAALYSGYCSLRQLLPEEQRALHTLVACRLAISVTNGALSQSKEPENEYLLLHAQPAWDALESWWVATPKGSIERELAGAVVSNAYMVKM